jgi:hypothetical protein
MGRTLMSLVALFTWTSVVLSGSSPDYDSADAKIQQIVEEQVPRGTTLRFSVAEVNAYVREEAEAELGDGLKNIDLRLGHDTITWRSLIDFAKLPELESLSSNWLLGRLLAGERPVTVEARLISGGGTVTVEVDSVEISGTRFEGDTLELLVDQLMRIIGPDIKAGEPYELDHNIERIDVRPEGVAVKIAD